MKRIVLLALMVGFAALGQPYPMLRTDINGVLYTPTNFFTANVADILAALAIDATETRSAIGLVIGTNVQAYDADLADLADGSLSGSKIGTGIDGGNVTAGTIVADRIESTIARLASPPMTGTPTVNGSNFMARIEEHLTEAEASTLYHRTNAALAVLGTLNGGSLTNLDGTAIRAGAFVTTNIFLPNRNRVMLFTKECVVGSAVAAGNMLNPELSGVVSSSATSVALLSEAGHPGLIRLASSSSANSSYGHYTGNTTFKAEVGLTWHSITRTQNTNAGVRVQWGFSDSTTGPTPVDAMRMWQSNNFLIPQIYSNSALVQGYEYPVASNQWIRVLVSVLSSNTVRFAAVDSSNEAVIVDTNLVGTLPDSSARVFGIGLGGIYTNAAASPLVDIDLAEAWYDVPVTR